VEASKLNISVSKGSWDSARKSNVSQMITLESIIESIKAQGLDDYTTNGLIEIASRYPANALISFKKNFNVMIRRVRAQRQKEQHGEFNNGQESREIDVPEGGSPSIDDRNQDAFEEFGDGDTQD